jgi:hypothetical protein
MKTTPPPSGAWQAAIAISALALYGAVTLPERALLDRTHEVAAATVDAAAAAPSTRESPYPAPHVDASLPPVEPAPTF